LPARFTEKVVGAIPHFVRPKTKLLAVKFRRILEVFALQALQKIFLGAFLRFVHPKTRLFAVKIRRILGVLCLSLTEKVVGAIPRFVRQKRSCLL